MKVMFYAPHAAVWPFAFTEALVAEALMQEGNEVYFVGCGRQLRSYCVAMSAHGLKFDAPESRKSSVCVMCERNKAFLRKRFGFAGTDIADEVSPDDMRHAEGMLEGATPENYLALEYSGIEVGRLALYEFLLNHKKNNLVIEAEKWPEFREAIRNVIYSAMASMKVIGRERPDRVIAYNSFYSVNHACAHAASRFAVPHYLMHAGNNNAHRFETLTLSKGYAYNYIARSPMWDSYQGRPCTAGQLAVVTDHMLSLFEATTPFVYSSPKSSGGMDLRRYFGISEGQRILVATMSSHDERFAAVTIGVMPQDHDLVFPSQVDWIDALKAFVAGRPDLFLLIRVHPREFQNKRESVVSEYASKLKAHLENLPGNARVNWPSDEVSLYDIAGVADLFLNSRSTTGLEMSLLGLPVLVYSPGNLFSYPSDLNYIAHSREEYLQQIDRALAHGWDIEFSRKAFRWGVFQYVRSTIDISESYAGQRSLGTGVIGRAINKVLGKCFPLFWQQMDFARKAPRLRSGKAIADFLASGKDTIVESLPVDPDAVSLDQETAALRTEFRRLYTALYRDQGDGAGPLQMHMRDFIGQDGG